MYLPRIIKRTAALFIALLFMQSIPAAAESVFRAEAEKGSAHVSRDEITSLDQVAAATPDQDFSFMRVLITTGDTSYIEIDLYGRYRFSDSTTLYGNTEGEAFPIRVSVSQGIVTVKDKTTGEVIKTGANLFLCRDEVHYDAGYAQLTYCASEKTLNRQYLGDFRFCAEGSKVNMINVVPMAYYLFGIVPYELNIYCQPEALKAQAVASKVYGMYFMDPNEPYDVQDGYTRSVYHAYRGFKLSRIAAMPYCEAVVGEGMSWNGFILYASYGHSNGGETSLPSHHSPSGNTQYDGAYEVVLDDIEFDNFTECTQYVNVTFGGVFDDTRFTDFVLCKARDSLGITPTRLVSVSEFNVYDPLPGTQRAMQKLHVKGKFEYEEEKGGMTVLSQKTFTLDCPTSELRSYRVTDIDHSGDSYSSSGYAFEENYRLYWGRTTSNGYKLIFARYGYGTGLSQMGAEIRANPDTYAQNHHQILDFYYPHFNKITINELPPTEAPSPSDVQDPDISAYAVCTVNGADFKVGPSSSFGTIGNVKKNEHIDIIELANTDWYHAVWNGQDGYIALDNVHIVMFPSPHDGAFTLMDGHTSTAANLRGEPRIKDGNVIIKLPKNTGFTAWMHFGKWYYVTTENGYAGFISNVVVDFGDPYEYTGASALIVRPPVRPISANPNDPPIVSPSDGRIGAE